MAPELHSLVLSLFSSDSMEKQRELLLKRLKYSRVSSVTRLSGQYQGAPREIVFITFETISVQVEWVVLSYKYKKEDIEAFAEELDTHLNQGYKLDKVVELAGQNGFVHYILMRPIQEVPSSN